MRWSSRIPTIFVKLSPRSRALIGLASLAIVAFAPRVARGALRHWDEAWYAEAAREMLESSSWLTVRWNFQPWFHKPPLAFWGTAFFFNAFGDHAWSARLFSALCGVGTVVAITSLAIRRAGVGAGALAGLCLLANPEFCQYATRGQLDAPVTFFICLRLLCFERGLSAPGWHWLGGVAVGLAAMTKGSAAGLALVVELAYAVVARDPRPFRQWPWWGSWLVAGLALAPWHLQQTLEHGWEFWSEYGARHFMQFFTDVAPRLEPSAPATFYLQFLLDKQWVWGWTIPALLVISWRRLPGDRTLALAWAWTASMPLALSLARTKWSWYLVPMYPGWALLAGLTLARTSVWRYRPKVVFCGALAAGAVCLACELARPANKESEDSVRAIAPLAQAIVPVGAPLHTLQTSKASRSVYPIATLYYCRRPTHAVSGLEHLQAVARQASNPFHLLAPASMIDDVVRAGSGPDGFAVEPLGRSGTVAFLKITPRPHAMTGRLAPEGHVR